MRIPQATRYLIQGMCPGVGGRFQYYGTTVYFPRGSTTFQRICEYGAYEPETITWLCRLARTGKVSIDVGASIGLTSVPVLRSVPDAYVLSFEPSPSALPYLERTWRESDFRARWEIVAKAASNSVGSAEFNLAASSDGTFDGLRDTKRDEHKRQVTVMQTTVDTEWERLGRPGVSCIKIDVEGAESRVLDGARDLIECEKPYLILEWNRQNIAPYEIDIGWLVDYATCHEYGLLALPDLTPIPDVSTLECQMLHTELFLLAPGSSETRIKDQTYAAKNSPQFVF